jgi:hypothetical protein
MARAYIIFLTIFITLGSTAQRVVDSAPTGIKNILPVEGGGVSMTIDSLTPLEELINKLEGNWNFLETGKGYWIGYTNDMFSIASHGDKAIDYLVNFFKATESKQGKFGAIYTLHLIGINSQIVGRYEEQFVNSKARFALLGLLGDDDFTYTIVELLMRDPWQADIPHFFNILEKEKDDEIIWPIVNSLKRYKLPQLPINNNIPDSIMTLTIKLKVKNQKVLEDDFDFNSQIKESLSEFENKFPSEVKVENELYAQDLSPYFKTKLSRSVNIRSFLSSLGIEPDNPFSYIFIGCKIQYYMYNNSLHFCTVKTARDLLISWWKTLPEEKKGQFK